VLKVNNIRSGYGEIEIIHDLSLNVEKEKIISIVGANGVGKSTLLKTITGLIKCNSGEIFFENKKISGKAAHNIVEVGISMVPEGRQLFPHLTVKENLEIGSSLSAVKAMRAEKLEEQFEMFPRLKERIKQLAGTLSGGEQQMLATARSLMAMPKLLIMDEPSWGLAPILVTEMFEKILEIKESGTSILLVEQNVTKALEIADFGYVMERGTFTLNGEGKELLNDKALKKAYLGI
jgi:branched-chain amino acid transport system ATP-binding protein